MSENKHLLCTSCGGKLIYQPDLLLLNCIHCNSKTLFEAKHKEIKYFDFDYEANEQTVSKDLVQYINCVACGAQIDFSTFITDSCPFCSSTIANNKLLEKRIIVPLSIIPFLLTRKQAFNNFLEWLKNLRFAPIKLTKYVRLEENFKGVYLPYYLINYSAKVEYKGKEEGKHGSSYSGKSKVELKNIALLATNVIPQSFKDKVSWNFLRLEPWNNIWKFDKLTSYQVEYTLGYTVETPQILLKKLVEQLKKEKDKISD